MTESPESPEEPKAIETLEEATAYLDGLINRERQPDYSYVRLDLKPIRALLEGLDHPERRLSVIHVAGSKGKGSTCLFAESILLALGESVGTFTSPHLESWVERFRIDGEPIDEARLVAGVERVRPIVERLRAGPRETLPSFFDATAAVAFLVFAEAGVDRALIEVGLGGRLDSTNVLDPAVTCITSIELEHTDKLGETEAEIAGEKAGILKPRVPAILGRLGPEASQVIRARAEEVGAPMRVQGEDFGAAIGRSGDTTRLLVEIEGATPSEIELATPGPVARLNASLALECVRALDAYSPEQLVEAASRGLSSCRLPARIEVLASDPAVIIDAAHTVESARALAEALTVLAPAGFDLLLSVSSDKNLDALLESLLPRARRVWTTRAEPIRSLDADVLAKQVSARAQFLGLELPVESEGDPERATIRARDALGSEGMLVAAGSVYLAGLARRTLVAPETTR